MLVVVSKVKALIKKEGMFTSAEACKILSEHVESLVRQAMVKSKNEGRKTVMDRDILSVINEGKKD